MTPQAIQQLQTQLGVPATGVFDTATSAAMQDAITKSISSNPDVVAYSAGTNPAAILNAYTTGDWSGVTSLTGKPFSDEQQKAAVAAADAALAPGFEASKANDTAQVQDTLRNTQQGLSDTVAADKTQFGQDKKSLDQSAADQGILFSGARTQKLNDLRTSYADKEALARRNAGEDIGSTVRGYQYSFGNDAAKNLSGLYSLPGASGYNANVAGGKVTPSTSVSSVYNPAQYNFQGTVPVAQKTAVQTRAASLLANNANKLSLSGIGAKF